MTKLLVIGGSGFFGKSILDAYSRGILNHWSIDEITILSRSAKCLLKTHPFLISSSVTLIESNIAECDLLPPADYVIHAAASSDAKNYLTKPTEEKNNILASTLNYCLLAKKYHSKAKIVYCSSGAVYGLQPAGVERITEEQNLEDIIAMPLIKRGYATAKRDAESAILRLGKDGLSVSIARCFAFIGPFLPRDQHFAIGNFIEDGLCQRPIKVKAPHSVIRSYMHSDDLVIWLMTLAEHSNDSCPKFNVGSDEALEIREVARKVADYFGVEVDRAPLEFKSVDIYVPNINKAKYYLNLSIKYQFNEALHLTIERIFGIKSHLNS